MRYDVESKTLSVNIKELVNLAHRGISAPEREDEAKKYSRELYPEAKKIRLSGNTVILGYSAEIFGLAEEISDGVITLERKVDTLGKRLPREDRERTRAEGFLLLYLYGAEKEAELCTRYYNADGELICEEREQPKAEALKRFFSKCIGVCEKYATPEIERVSERLPAYRALKFPYPAIREGQSDFIHAVHRTIAHGTQLCASLPTGTGKTVSVLYPALRALGEGRCDKIFYLTPKHTAARAASECLELFASQGVTVKACILYSKETLCSEGLTCRRPNGGCRLSSLSSIPDAVLSLYNLNKAVVLRADFERVGKEYGICPHELALCYSELCDVVICDFNYLFDPQIYLKRYFTEGGRYVYLIDEAHNLPERAREMYSSELSTRELDELLSNPLLPQHSAIREAIKTARDSIEGLFFPYLRDELHERERGEKVGAVCLHNPPSDLYTIVYTFLADAEAAYRASLRDKDGEATERTLLLRELYYRLKKLGTSLEKFDEKYRLFLFYEGGVLNFRLFCIDTGGVISDRVRTGNAAVFFSATLEPLVYYRSLLGADGTTDSLTAGSPFDPSQLSVSIVDSVSTRYSERERTAPAVCRAIAAMISARRGHYMIFCPSFEYLELLAGVFTEKYPKLHTVIQKRDMTAEEKRAFLDEFKNCDGKYLIAFCVLGGIYSEGVDLTGDSLIGAAIVGIGMPTLSYERESMRDYFNDKYEAGTEYAYLYPGMNKVFQAAGRVIRTEDDRGVILLIDDRFRDPIYKKSIPSLWRGMKYVGDAKELKARTEAFWKRVDEDKK
ncbi:MAG: ATP-dependent DNA helicase [Clostridia bacterium]|nr:ATP-dependent DNA helicase [Clostridia bacterium]